MALKIRHSNNVAIVEEETDDLINCSVCLEVYNDQERKPKFLPCSHTICLKCLQAIIDKSSRHCNNIQCPLCREKTSVTMLGAANFPNNPYILHIMNMKQWILENHQFRAKGAYWCLTCGSSLIHSSCNMNLSGPIKSDFDVAESLFILKFKHGSVLLGEVYIKPSASFNSILMKEWGDICFRKARLSDCQIMKLQPQNFVTLDVEHPYFTSRVPSCCPTVQASQAFDVGVAINTGQGQWINGWEFIFLLKNLPPRHLVSLEFLPHSSLFGKVIKGYDVLNRLACSGSNQDHPSDLFLTWESV